MRWAFTVALQCPEREAVQNTETLTARTNKILLISYSPIIFLKKKFFFWPCHVAFQILVPPTRDWTHDPCIGSMESYPVGHQGSPVFCFLSSHFSSKKNKTSWKLLCSVLWLITQAQEMTCTDFLWSDEGFFGFCNTKLWMVKLRMLILKFFFYLGVWLINGVVSVSGVPQSESVIRVIYVLIQVLCPFRLLQSIEQISLWLTPESWGS